MAKRLGLLLLVLSTVAIAAAYGAAFLPGGAPRWAAWLMAMANATLAVGVMLLGAVRHGQPVGRLAFPLGFTFVVIAGAFGLALWLPGGDGAGTPLFLGLPPRAAIVLYGVGLLPMFVLPLAYALTFDELTLRAEDLERVRALARSREREHGAAVADRDVDAADDSRGGGAAGVLADRRRAEGVRS